MAKYNTFVVQATKNGKALLVTSSARKARQLLIPGARVEVWSENERVETIYTRTRARLDRYIEDERAYIRAKQAKAERRNLKRRAQAHDHTTRPSA